MTFMDRRGDESRFDDTTVQPVRLRAKPILSDAMNHDMKTKVNGSP
jgi:hypothetical protein